MLETIPQSEPSGTARPSAVSLLVIDPERSAEFYSELLGLSPTGFSAVSTQMRGGNGRVVLELVQGGGALREDRRHSRITWSVATIEELVRAKEALEKRNSFHSEADAGWVLSIVGEDLDGNPLEVAWAKPEADWEEVDAATLGADLPGALKRWGGTQTLRWH